MSSLSRLVLSSSIFASTVWAIQPEAQPAVAAPLRELPWSQLNILHTTDVHGWFGGHLQEPSFSADWGDYISFADHLRKRADKDGSDLILVDTGDRVEGNGLYDGSEPKGEYTFDILKEQPIDLICSGNHELYKANSSNNELEVTVPSFKENYIASNLDIYDPRTGERRPLAQRFRKFETKNQKIRILAFGFLFDFTGNANNTIVKPVKETVKESWFQEAIRDAEVDLILVFGHVAIRSSPEFDAIFKEIRGVNWDIPIALLGGHSHIRDFKKYDSRSYALESGRYMETIGFMSIDGLTTGKKKVTAAKASTAFSRLYLDNNLFSMHHHSNTSHETFDTKKGLDVSRAIHSARAKLKLDKVRGCAPQDLFVNRAPYPANNSIFTWLEKQVLPAQLAKSKRMTLEGKRALMLTNTGSMRFDIFRGPFTRDTEYLVSPFTSGFRYVKDVPWGIARRILALINNETKILVAVNSEQRGQASAHLTPPEEFNSHSLEDDSTFADEEFSAQTSVTKFAGRDLIPGYTTSDDYGKDGDDTLHTPIKFWNVPNAFQAPIGFEISEKSESSANIKMELRSVDDSDTVDVVYNEFIQPWVLLALEYLSLKVPQNETAVYLEGKTMTDVIVEWVEQNWDKDCIK